MKDLAVQLLLGLLGALSLIGSGFWFGAEWTDRAHDKERAKQAFAHARAVSDARAEEQRKASAATVLAERYRKEKEDADKTYKADVAALKSRLRRMSVPVVSCPAGGTPEAGADPGKLADAPRAELHPEIAATIRGIGHDADQVTRDLNHCIEQLYDDRKERKPWLG